MKESDFPDNIAYTRAIVKQVRQTHSIDDRLENARKESISKENTTRNVFPTSLSNCLVDQDESGLKWKHKSYYVKAMIPICKETFREEFSLQRPHDKPKFKLIK